MSIIHQFSFSQGPTKRKILGFIFLLGCTSVFIYLYSAPNSIQVASKWNERNEKVTISEQVFLNFDAGLYSPKDEQTGASSLLERILNIFKIPTPNETRGQSITEQRSSLVSQFTVVGKEFTTSKETYTKELYVKYISSVTQTNNFASKTTHSTPNTKNNIKSSTFSFTGIQASTQPTITTANEVSSTAQNGSFANKVPNTADISTLSSDISVTDGSDQTLSTTQHINVKTSQRKTEFQNWVTASDKSTPVTFRNFMQDVEKAFLVHSSQCRIPNIDPMHPSIKQFVEISPPLDCSDYGALTKTEENLLYVDKPIADNKHSNFTCCYQSVLRAREGSSDNGVEFGKECKNFFNKTVVHEEFIKVTCQLKNNNTIHKDYHSFIHDKPKVEERCKQFDSISKYSILMVGLDSMSRMNMHRQISRTAQYFLDEMSGVEMYGYNKVGDNTFPNLIPVMLGYDERELTGVCWNSSGHEPLDKCNFMWKKFAEKGYRTFYAEDTPYISSFNYVKRGFFYQPTDYYFRHFILAYEDDLGRNKSLNCYECVGPKSETEVVLEWTQQFAMHFRDRAYFAFVWMNSLTHDFLNKGSSGDHIFEKFFRNLHQSGALTRTIVILMSDHGMRWGSIRKTYIGRLEERLPMMMISLPPEFKTRYPNAADSLQRNANRLTTPFDLHATLENILHLDQDWHLTNSDAVSDELSAKYEKRATSLFQPIPVDRSCTDAGIDEHWCTCEMSLQMDTDNANIKIVSAFLVDYINSLLQIASDMCAVLRLSSITDARLWQPMAEHEGHTQQDLIYTAVIQTLPGAGTFEGTVRYNPNKNTSELLGTVSRLNLYGEQSACVKNAALKKYCFCL